MKVITEAREKEHMDWLHDFLKENGRLPTLREDIFSEGLEIFTNPRSPEQRKDWVHRTLSKGLPADDDQSAAVAIGHGAADVDLTAAGSTTEEDDDLGNILGP
jgi:hypothetical protein